MSICGKFEQMAAKVLGRYFALAWADSHMAVATFAMLNFGT